MQNNYCYLIETEVDCLLGHLCYQISIGRGFKVLGAFFCIASQMMVKKCSCRNIECVLKIFSTHEVSLAGNVIKLRNKF